VASRHTAVPHTVQHIHCCPVPITGAIDGLGQLFQTLLNIIPKRIPTNTPLADKSVGSGSPGAQFIGRNEQEPQKDVLLLNDDSEPHTNWQGRNLFYHIPPVSPPHTLHPVQIAVASVLRGSWTQKTSRISSALFPDPLVLGTLGGFD